MIYMIYVLNTRIVALSAQRVDGHITPWTVRGLIDMAV